MATVLDLLSASLREIGVLGGGETARSEDSTDALAALNRLIDQWAAERLNIFAITRTLWDIGSGVGEYEFGRPSSAPSSAAYSQTTSDGFDTTWRGCPPNWTTGTLTSSGTINNETTITQAGGHSVKLDVPALGAASIYRDLTVFCGTDATVSIYLRGDGGGGTGAIVRVQCVETGSYLDSTGAWQGVSADTFTRTAATFALSSLDFEVEDESVVGGQTCTLRVTLYTDSFGPVGYFDTFELVNTVPGVIVAGTFGIPIPRPTSIDYVNLVDANFDPAIETPLTPLTDAAWARLAMKDMEDTRPQAWYYENTIPDATFNRQISFPYSRLHLWPIPTGTGLQGAIYIPTQITGFTSLTAQVSLPPGYEELIVTSLAIRLCVPYKRTAPPELIQAAAHAKGVVKRSNLRLQDVSFDAAALIGGARGGYDIRSDQ